MSLRSQSILPIPEQTARIAKAAFPKGNVWIKMRDELGSVFADAQFANLFPPQGQPAETPWRLALVVVMQFAENLPDRQAADAVRSRIDWKYALGLELTDPVWSDVVVCYTTIRMDIEVKHMAQPEFVTETFDYDGGRQVTVYVPPDPPEAIVFAGDGQMISQWGGFLEAADVPSTLIVGVHRVVDETLRLHEYSPGFDPERFAAHERFFVEDVGAWARSRFGVTLSAERTAVFGVSAGGELALALGLRHPDLYGAIFSGSPGRGYRPPHVLPTPLPRTYLVAGTLEPFFLDNAARWAAALRDADADVVMSERVAGHDDAMWRAEFPLMVAWAFGG